MNEEVQVQWQAALRSDEYEQGFGRLTTVCEDGTEQDCCLGVLCKLAVAAGVIERKDKQQEGWDRPVVFYGKGKFPVEDWMTGLLPKAVVEWAGLDLCNPRTPYQPDLETSTLSDANDSHHADFSHIADLIGLL